MGALTIAVVVLASVEIGYLLKTLFWVVGSKIFRSRAHPFDSSYIYGMVTTRDVDFMINHMNNSRYLRCMDFGRVDHLVRSNIYKTLRRFSGCAVVRSSTVRYRKPLYIFMPYSVSSEIAYWDDNSIYYKQEIRSLHDDFIRSAGYVQVALINCDPVTALSQTLASCPKQPDSLQLEPLSTPEQMMERFLQLKPLTPDLQSFIEFNSNHSIRLKAQNIVENTTQKAKQLVDEKKIE